MNAVKRWVGLHSNIQHVNGIESTRIQERRICKTAECVKVKLNFFHSNRIKTTATESMIAFSISILMYNLIINSVDYQKLPISQPQPQNIQIWRPSHHSLKLLLLVELHFHRIQLCIIFQKILLLNEYYEKMKIFINNIKNAEKNIIEWIIIEGNVNHLFVKITFYMIHVCFNTF